MDRLKNLKLKEILPIVILVIALPITILLSLQRQEFRNRAAGPQNDQATLVAQAKDLSNRLIHLQMAYDKASPQAQDQLSQLIQVSNDRRLLLNQLFEKSPDQVIKLAISSQVRQNFPAEVQTNLEEEVTVEGVLAHSHSDNFESETDQEYYSIKSGNNVIGVHFNQDPEVQSDSSVTLKGVKLDDNMAVDSTTKSNVQVKTPPVLGTTTTKRMAVILFSNSGDFPYPKSDIQNYYFNSAADYYNETSYGDLSIQGGSVDIYGPYSFSFSPSNCTMDGIWDTWGDPLRSKAENHGFVASNYSLVSYMFPRNTNCSWNGRAIIGTYDGFGQSFINGVYNPVGVISHEIGHNLNANHAQTYDCYNSSGTRVSISSNCSVGSEYGDPFDVMGKTATPRQMSAYHKNKPNNNWLDSSNMLTVDRATNPDSTYTITPLEINSTGLKSLRIPRIVNSDGSISQYYYLEYRQPSGTFDNFSSDSPAVNGVIIRLAPDYSLNYDTDKGRSKLLDMTPGTSGFGDAPLGLNKSFVDSARLITIIVKSTSSTGAQVEVKFGTPSCDRNQPTATLSPSSQSGVPGSSLPYTLTVKNNDIGCTASNFTISGNLPTGFTQTAPSTIQVSSGGIGSVPINVTSPFSVDTNNIYYQFTETIDDSNHSAVTSNIANYNIQLNSGGTGTGTGTGDIISPTVRITSPTNGSQLSKGSLKMTATASDNVGVSSLKIYLDDKLQKTCTGVTSCSDNSPLNGISKGTHSLKAVATDKSGNSSTATISFSVL